MFDLDHLKKINDTHGHHAGDELIRAVGDICLPELRKTDTACRFGGDEFVIALPNTELEHALQFANRLCERFRQGLSRFSVDGVSATVSFGVAMVMAEDRSYEDTLKRADTALYEAKRRGKNQVVSV